MLRRPRALLAALPVCLLALAGCGGGSDSGTPVDPQQAVCEWLEDEVLPELTTSGSNLGAQTTFADDWATWVAADESRPRTAAELDTLAEQGCARTRERALTALGTDSFADVLG